MTGGYMPLKGGPDLDDIRAAFREALVENPRLAGMPGR
jgi:hypothetical protein